MIIDSRVIQNETKRRHKKMKGLAERVENLFMAVTFAEAGEFDTAREILREEERPQKIERIQPDNRLRKEVRAPGIGRQ
jgi:hypothetical protein